MDVQTTLFYSVLVFLLYCVAVSKHLLMSSTPSIMFELLGRYNWPKKYIPRVIGLLILQCVFAPGRWLEKFLFDSTIRSTTLRKDPIFIIGHWRSGTTHLHNLFAQDPQFAYCTMRDTLQPWTSITNWSWPFFAFSVPDVRDVDGMKMGPDAAQEEEIAYKMLSNHCWLQVEWFPTEYERFFREDILFEGQEGVKAKRAISEAILYWARKLTFKYGGKQLVLKNPSNTGRVKLLRELFPNAKFIHIHRNPYDVFPSQIKNIKWILDTVDFQNTNTQKMAEEFTAWTYPEFMKLTLEYKNQVAEENFYELSFDDLERRPVEIMREIYEKFRIDDFSEKRFRDYLATVSTHKKNTFSMPEATVEKINKSLDFVFKRYNYPMRYGNAGQQ